MFEYLSFLRPPPERCSLHQQVTLVPQISNDLRTEPSQDEHDIYFAWQNSSGQIHCKGFTKLTTWRPDDSMYKPLGVALPPEAQPGDAWRLCLSVGHIDTPLVLDLAHPAFGRLPFPLISLPITVVAGDKVATPTNDLGMAKKPRAANRPPKGKPRPDQNNQVAHLHAPKQEKIQRFYLLPVGTPVGSEIGDRLMRITEQISFDLDKKIWDSGIGVSSWLARLLVPSSDSGSGYSPPSAVSTRLIESFRRRLTTRLKSPQIQELQVIELGAGTGIVSLVLAVLLARCNPELYSSCSAGAHHARILATDLFPALELIRNNRSINEHIFCGNLLTTHEACEFRCTCQVDLREAELDWEKPIPTSVWGKSAETGALYPFDVIIMADVTYNTASFGSLLDTVSALLRGPNASSSSPMILLAYKCRDAAERTLWADALARGIVFVQVATVAGVKEPAVEIWIGGWKRDVESLWSECGNNFGNT